MEAIPNEKNLEDALTFAGLWHRRKIAVAYGERLKRGKVIDLVGNTCLSGGLFIEIKRNLKKFVEIL